MNILEWLNQEIETMNQEELKKVIQQLLTKVEYNDLHQLFGERMTRKPKDQSLTLQDISAYQPWLDKKNETLSGVEYRFQHKGEKDGKQIYYWGIYDLPFEGRFHYQSRKGRWGWYYELVFENDILQSIIRDHWDSFSEVSEFSYLTQEEFKKKLDDLVEKVQNQSQA